MSSYKLVSEFIKIRQPEFYTYNNFLNRLYYVMIEEDNGENENSVEFIDRSEKNMIKLYLVK